ncbi:MAG: hypothetical protein ACE5Z5_10700 [Candidatus Bathyarchaeia archaeon]
MTQLTCPTCDGTGYISNIPNLENLRIVGFNNTVDYELLGCDLWAAYDIVINATVANDSPTPIEGPLLVSIRDATFGELYSEKTVFFEVPANATNHTVRVEVDFSVYLEGRQGLPVLEIDVSLPEGVEIPCPTCDGKGKLPLLLWFTA